MDQSNSQSNAPHAQPQPPHGDSVPDDVLARQRAYDPSRTPGTPEYHERQQAFYERAERIRLRYGVKMLHEMLAERNGGEASS